MTIKELEDSRPESPLDIYSCYEDEEFKNKISILESLGLETIKEKFVYYHLNDFLKEGGFQDLSLSDLSKLLMGSCHNSYSDYEYSYNYANKEWGCYGESLMRYRRTIYPFYKTEWRCRFYSVQDVWFIQEKQLELMDKFKTCFHGYLFFRPDDRYRKLANVNSIILGMINRRKSADLRDERQCTMYYLSSF